MVFLDLSFNDNTYLEYTLLFIMIIGLILILIGNTYFIVNKKNITNIKIKKRSDTEKYSNLSIAFGICLFLSAIILQIIYCVLNTKCLSYL